MPSSTSSPGLRTRSLVAFAQILLVNTPGLSRGGFTLKGGIQSGVGSGAPSLTHKPGTEGEFGWSPSSSITVGHRAGHR
jgi:hypothetical protein